MKIIDFDAYFSAVQFFSLSRFRTYKEPAHTVNVFRIGFIITLRRYYGYFFT